MSDIEVPRIADTETDSGADMCGRLVARSGPRQRGKTVPAAWAANAEAWWEHIHSCPYCSQFYEEERPDQMREES